MLTITKFSGGAAPIRRSLPCLALSAMIVSAPLQAQPNTLYGREMGETRAEVAFTLPLGHSSRRTETSPRLDFQVRQRVDAMDLAAVRRADDARWHERRLGFTLQGPTRLMINGREIEQGSTRHGVSDGALIAGGIVLALGVGVLIFYDALDDASD